MHDFPIFLKHPVHYSKERAWEVGFTDNCCLGQPLIPSKMGTNPQENRPKPQSSTTNENLTLKQKLFRLKKVQNVPENSDNGANENQFKVRKVLKIGSELLL